MKQALTMPLLFRQQKEEWLATARITARKLLRTKTRITIEDVLAVCPLPKFLHRNTIGSVFQTREFQKVGRTMSRRHVSHGREIKYWALSEEYSHGVDRDECV